VIVDAFIFLIILIGVLARDRDDDE